MPSRLIIKHRRNHYLFSHRPFTSDPATAGNSGTGGASLYVSSGPAGSVPPPIVYRRFRLLRPGRHILALGNVVTGSKTTRVATVTSPTAQFPAIALDSSKAYRMQVRTWKDDQELPTNFGERLFNTDGSTAQVSEIAGSGYLIRTELCQGGGVKFIFSYNASVEGIQPTEFVLQRQSGPTSPTDVTTTFYTGQRLYELQVAGLDDEGDYVFRIAARNDSVTKLIDNAAGSGVYDIPVTADASGPPAVSAVAWEER